jgi:hypothetical protein
MPLYTGTLGTSTISAQQPIIARFANGAVLEFGTLDDAHGFLRFYHQNPKGRTENPAKIYQLASGVWLHQHPEKDSSRPADSKRPDNPSLGSV